MALHNFCVMRRDSSARDMMSVAEYAEIQSYSHALLQCSTHEQGSSRVPGRRQQSTRSLVRNNLVKIVRGQHLRRPPSQSSYLSRS